MLKYLMDSISLITKKLDSYNISPLAQKTFLYNYEKLLSNNSGFILSQSIDPLSKTDAELVYQNPLYFSNEIIEKLKKVVVIKLNGGLGTSMGMKGAKSQLKVKETLNFIDICVKQIEVIRSISSVSVPLIFMNSFNTQEETEASLKKLNFENNNLPTFFIENKIPKLKKDLNGNYTPAAFPENPSLEWAPPGHADIYPALYENNLLNQFLEKGYEYIFVSNVDNLGASLDFEILEKVFNLNSPFVMEVANRTEDDKKGGHLAVDKNSKNYILRESAQVTSSDTEDFQDYHKYKFFNTNSIWIKIQDLIDLMKNTNGILNIPIIINKKNINPLDSNSEEIIQLESAMGSAISLFKNAKTILVPSERFIPVKNTSNLLYLRSDLVSLDKNYRLKPLKNIKIELNPMFYKNISDFENRIKVVPSLINATFVKINSEVIFDKPIEISGSYEV